MKLKLYSVFKNRKLESGMTPEHKSLQKSLWLMEKDHPSSSLKVLSKEQVKISEDKFKDEVFKLKKVVNHLQKKINDLFPSYSQKNYVVEKYVDNNVITVGLQKEGWVLPLVKASIDGSPFEEEIKQDNLLAGGPYTTKISFDTMLIEDWKVYYNKGTNLGILHDEHVSMGGASSSFNDETWRFDTSSIRHVLPALKIAEKELDRKLVDDGFYSFGYQDYKLTPTSNYSVKIITAKKKEDVHTLSFEDGIEFLNSLDKSSYKLIEGYRCAGGFQQADTPKSIDEIISTLNFEIDGQKKFIEFYMGGSNKLKEQGIENPVPHTPISYCQKNISEKVVEYDLFAGLGVVDKNNTESKLISRYFTYTFTTENKKGE